VQHRAVKNLPTKTDLFVPAVARPNRAVSLSDGHVLFSSHGHRYLASVLELSGPATGPLRFDDPVCPAAPADVDGLAAHLRYGGHRSFLLDMQGIDTFLFARAKLFRDATARQAALSVGLLDSTRRYLRVGAAGAPPGAHHPGGEVLECAVLNGADLRGYSCTSSGFLPPGEEFSRAAALRIGTEADLLDGRSVYSHTAFLTEAEPTRNPTIALRIGSRDRTVNVLDAMSEFLLRNRITAYAVRLFVTGDVQGAPASHVIGRVLRRLPTRPFTRVEQATAIASEQAFSLSAAQELIGFGTHYPRYTPEWSTFRGGKPYEPRGHIHIAVLGAPAGPRQHAISHLRELFVHAGSACTVLLTPVLRAVRVDPVVHRGADLVSRSSGRTLIKDLNVARRTS
jgi:hypothetical protein